jgi:hypothetical protein
MNFRIINELTLTQKMSMCNLLYCLAMCDKKREDTNVNIELKFMNTFAKTLQVSPASCMNQLSNGIKLIVDDLKNLNQEQKELLITASWDMVNFNGPNEIQLRLLNSDLYRDIGITYEIFMEAVNKNKNPNHPKHFDSDRDEKFNLTKGTIRGRMLSSWSLEEKAEWLAGFLELTYDPKISQENLDQVAELTRYAAEIIQQYHNTK